MSGPIFVGAAHIVEDNKEKPLTARIIALISSKGKPSKTLFIEGEKGGIEAGSSYATAIKTAEQRGMRIVCLDLPKLTRSLREKILQHTDAQVQSFIMGQPHRPDNLLTLEIGYMMYNVREREWKRKIKFAVEGDVVLMHSSHLERFLRTIPGNKDVRYLSPIEPRPLELSPAQIEELRRLRKSRRIQQGPKKPGIAKRQPRRK
ncbi:MAG: hypothetical protein PHD95_05765 [Candidatus ainarchaeum sp.]|nr:hypothetical protein [Candidatus ainarchaeum sp.]